MQYRESNVFDNGCKNLVPYPILVLLPMELVIIILNQDGHILPFLSGSFL
jgi:hypothetical protein